MKRNPSEINVIRKAKRSIQGRIGLIYPNSYSMAMSGLTIKLLYSLLNEHPNVYTERVFFSPKSFAPPASIETGKHLNEFDILAFTFQFELDYVNAIKMLQKSKIPVFNKDRDVNHPIILAGGPAITASAIGSKRKRHQRRNPAQGTIRRNLRKHMSLTPNPQGVDTPKLTGRMPDRWFVGRNGTASCTTPRKTSRPDCHVASRVLPINFNEASALPLCRFSFTHLSRQRCRR